MNGFGKVGEYKSSIQKSVSFLHANDELSESQKTIPFTTAPNKIKYLGINLNKEIKDLYSEKL